ncbi:hypothetical protein SCG7086_AZ_00140 [Chlamydiales bacterium SCGC AG-110-P3]|nr:hypothetical protein SCG7086_AZ_00140 [Chlamydiales bacterium SCGC AG-110-P3]
MIMKNRFNGVSVQCDFQQTHILIFKDLMSIIHIKPN